ncbi:L,D-transpeptidase family protein [Bifidobacterium sp. SMA15]|uniref:L,D-transpeptidase family protein n=2 Tax=Bifidobacterium platyrrhinorum TaxID=2661628 RepID=A0A6L9STQ4_9BIFI|nr:L,D-transpeptidase family protein [Bifidobacterium platyrrhinorum]
MREDFETTQAMPPITPDEAAPLAGTSGTGIVPPAGVAAAAAVPPEDLNIGTTAARKSRKGLIITLSLVAVLLVALVGAFFGARAYYADKVAPGVRFGSASVVGQTRDEVKATVDQAIKDSAVTVKDSNGKSVTASLKDLGVNIDVDQTVDAIMDAKSSSNIGEDILRVNPFGHVDVPLTASTDNAALSDFLSAKLVSDDERAVPSSIAYDANAQAFAATEGRAGKTPKVAKVVSAVKQAIAEPGTAASVSITDETIDTPISLEAAQKAADAANQRLNNKIVMTNGNAKQFELPNDAVASWIKAESRPSQGAITLSYDSVAIKKYMAEQLPGQLNQDMVSQEDIVDGNGSVIVAAQVKGVDGVAVKDTDKAAEQVLDTLKEGNGGTVQVTADVTKFDVKQKQSEWRVVIDKSSQTAVVYHNGQQVKSFLVCTGGPGGNETDSGNWYIYLKYRVQDMRGYNDDGSKYLSPGVKWVSYFNGGEGFHTASWNYGGIASGDPANHGSHGCVNMYEQDAEWIYENCPEGTLVQVVGTQPSGPVR